MENTDSNSINDMTIDRICKQCSRSFTPYNTLQRYCSRKCAQHANYERYKLKQRGMIKSEPINITLDCALCSASFVRHARRQKYCSKKCAKQAHNIVVRDYARKASGYRATARCKVCDTPFTKARQRLVYCSDECKRIGRARINREHAREYSRAKLNRPVRPYRRTKPYKSEMNAQ